MWESRELVRVIVGTRIHNLLARYDFKDHPNLLHEYSTKRSLFGIPVAVKEDGVANHLTFVVSPPWGPEGKPPYGDRENSEETLGPDGSIDP
jgi:hypothetical protein